MSCGAVFHQAGGMDGPVICGIENDGDLDCIYLGSRLAEALGEELLLAHAVAQPAAVPTPMLPHGPFPPQAEMRQALLDQGTDVLNEVASRTGVPETAGRLLVGEPADALARVAEEEEAGLLVVGARRRGPLRRALVGSVSARLVSVSPCPVAVLPRDPATEVPLVDDVVGSSARPKVICAVDRISDLGSVPAVASRFADALAASVEIVHVLPPGAAADLPPSGVLEIGFGALLEGPTRSALALVRAAQRCVRGHVESHLHLRVGDAVSQLNVLAEELEGALIVIGTRGRGPWRQALLGSTSAGLVVGGAAPVVVVPSSGGEDD